MPVKWSQAILYPIYKEGDRVEPGGYRIIAILYHVRKIIECALDWEVREYCVLNSAKCGFRKNNGIKTALLIYQYAVQAKNSDTAVLDLKWAYPSVLRVRLLQVLISRLP